MVGLTRCKKHYGGSDKSKEQHQRVKLRNGLGRLVQPVAEDDPEVDPFQGFVMEVRRTLGAIRYYEEKIESLPELEAFWGIVKEEDVDATEFAGTNVTREAKPNVYIVAWQWERVHLLDLHKVWITARMDERRWNAEQRMVDDLDSIVTAVVVGLGRDPRDPDVRDVVRRALAGLKGRSHAATVLP